MTPFFLPSSNALKGYGNGQLLFCSLFIFKVCSFFPNLESYKLYVLVLHHPHTFMVMVMVMVHDHVSITQTDSCYNLTVATSKKKKEFIRFWARKSKPAKKSLMHSLFYKKTKKKEKIAYLVLKFSHLFQNCSNILKYFNYPCGHLIY